MYRPWTYRPDVTWPVALALTACAIASCSRDVEPEPSEQPQVEAAAKPVDVLVFPDELRVKDQQVNAFVERAMRQCAAGDYDQFRLLWSARGDLLRRDEYEQGWQAVQQIKVRALERVLLASNPKRGRHKTETVYALLADVSLDPTHAVGRDEQHRDVALMLVKEHEQWRLARAPSEMRMWLRERAGTESPPTSPTDDE